MPQLCTTFAYNKQTFAATALHKPQFYRSHLVRLFIEVKDVVVLRMLHMVCSVRFNLKQIYNQNTPQWNSIHMRMIHTTQTLLRTHCQREYACNMHTAYRIRCSSLRNHRLRHIIQFVQFKYDALLLSMPTVAFPTYAFLEIYTYIFWY